MDGGKSANYTTTNDPNVVIGRHGARITMDDFKHANANGYAWKDFPAYADYVGAWAHNTTQPAAPPPPYYRVYGGQPNLNTGDIEILKAKYQNDPAVSSILNRNIAPAGEVHTYSLQDADVIKSLIDKEKVTSQSSNYPGFGLQQAYNNVKK